MPARHDQDAGRDADLLAAKAALRNEMWAALREAKMARFPGPKDGFPTSWGRKPREALRGTDAWGRAHTVKSNPDSPQWPVRQRVLEDGKTLYMAVPRLAEAKPFFLLDPDHLADPPRKASSIKGASRSARTVDLDALEPVDLVVTGCVAAGEDGASLGKGGGFSDLPVSLARSLAAGRDTRPAGARSLGELPPLASARRAPEGLPSSDDRRE